MKIIDILNQDRPTLSFEVFPPKTSDTYDSVAKATQDIAALRPDFMSVTYGAGGGTSDYTVGIAAGIPQQYGVDVLPSSLPEAAEAEPPQSKIMNMM